MDWLNPFLLNSACRNLQCFSEPQAIGPAHQHAQFQAPRSYDHRRSWPGGSTQYVGKHLPSAWAARTDPQRTRRGDPLQPEFAWAYYNLALVSKKQERRDETAQELRAALKADPQFRAARAELESGRSSALLPLAGGLVAEAVKSKVTIATVVWQANATVP